MTKFFKPLGLAALGIAVWLACVAEAQAQDKGAPEKAARQKGGKGAFGPKGSKSPEVSANGSVTFRLPLPNLQKVELDGDFKRFAFS
jgi:hypothetical protein